MSKWVLSANGSVFNHGKAFQEYGFIDWKQTRNFSVGDTVYIYMTKPEARIRFKTKVELINLSYDVINDYSKFWVKKEFATEEKKYVRLVLIEEYDISELQFEYLHENGMRYAPQSPCRVNEIKVSQSAGL